MIHFSWTFNFRRDNKLLSSAVSALFVKSKTGSLFSSDVIRWALWRGNCAVVFWVSVNASPMVAFGWFFMRSLRTENYVNSRTVCSGEKHLDILWNTICSQKHIQMLQVILVRMIRMLQKHIAYMSCKWSWKYEFPTKKIWLNHAVLNFFYYRNAHISVTFLCLDQKN